MATKKPAKYKKNDPDPRRHPPVVNPVKSKPKPVAKEPEPEPEPEA